MPFRERPEDQLGPLTVDRAVHDAVGQMVRQFADAYAFLRELVQNSLDADATAIDVLLDHHTVDGRAVLEVSVRDDGRGMDQDTVERSLLVLFRSTKERDATRIGKFGVGFFSVFAASPDRVVVETGRDLNAPGLHLTLLPDFTWELASAAPRKGTAVRVRIPLRDKRPEAIADLCVERLKHWCPYVRVPVTARFHNVPDRDGEVRIDAAHAIESAVQVREARDGVTAVVGLSATPSRRYYNRGLLLQSEEGATAPEHRALVLLLDAPDLHHTISRDAVVRDAAFAKRVDRVNELVRGPLRKLALRRWQESATACARARHADTTDRAAGAMLGFLARVFRDGPFAVGGDDLPWPLLEPAADGAVTGPLATGFFRNRTLYTGRRRGALSTALGARGERILDLAPAGDDADDAAIGDLLRVVAPQAVAIDHGWIALSAPPAITLDEGESLLRDALQSLAESAGVRGVELVSVEGTGADRLWYAIAPGRAGEGGVSLLSLRADAPFTVRADGFLALRRDHPDTLRALRAARVDAPLAALALLRLVLLQGGRLDAETDAGLFTRHAAVRP